MASESGQGLTASTGVFHGPDAPSEEDLYKCVHCGLCLNACPTYLELGLETESPRGRIALMKAANEGRIQITRNVVSHWDLCLQCRACEAVCPSGVPYGNLIKSVKAQIEPRLARRSLVGRFIQWLSYEQLLPHQRRLEILVAALRLYQRTGLQSLVRWSRLLQLMPGNLGKLESTMPEASPTFFRPNGRVVPPQGRRRARVAILSGCVMPLLHQPAMEAAVRVLSRNGCEVVISRGQACCGALNSHAGRLESARRMARHNIDAFLAANVDAVVVNSAGCGAAMKEYGHLLEDDPLFADKAQEFGEMVKDIHEFLVSLPLAAPKAPLDLRVTYQDSCHLAHAQRIKDAPRQILSAIPGLRLVEMATPGKCCGAAGSYAITQWALSQQLMQSKIDDVSTTEADVIATANPGCVIQLQAGVRRRGIPMDVKYVVDLLDQAYSMEEPS